MTLSHRLSVFFQRCFVLRDGSLVDFVQDIGNRSVTLGRYICHGFHCIYPTGRRWWCLRAFAIVLIYFGSLIRQSTVQGGITTEIPLHHRIDTVKFSLDQTLHRFYSGVEQDLFVALHQFFFSKHYRPRHQTKAIVDNSGQGVDCSVGRGARQVKQNNHDHNPDEHGQDWGSRPN